MTAPSSGSTAVPAPTAPPTLAQLNAATLPEFVGLMDGIYEHSPWVPERAAACRPFATPAALRQALAGVVQAATPAEQLGLIRAHPELAGKAMVARTLTAESTGEQGRAGLTHCTPEEFARIGQLNRDYNARFGFPFILAVRGPRGAGLDRAAIIQAFERRLRHRPAVEHAEALRQIHRIAEIRLNERLAIVPAAGEQVWDWAEALARHSEPEWAGRGQLTVTYLTPAHRACAADIMALMREACGFDEVTEDAVGNVVGVYHGHDRDAPRLLTGSHYDTVRNGGKYDGRLGILVPMACVQALHRRGVRLPFGIEVVGFSEEEGQRFPATFLGSAALTGSFNPDWLTQRDAGGAVLGEVMRAAGLNPDDIAALRRDPARYLGFVEVHIEQGPVLCGTGLPLGVVTSINGSVRFLGEITGTASHAGTTPMNLRADAAAAAAELIGLVERRAAQVPDLVGTVGMLEVPGGSINVVPGRCRFSLDIRATTDAVRDACLADVRAGLAEICARRGVECRLDETMRAAAAPSHPAWQARWERAVAALGLPVLRMPSGAGHDAMKLHEILPQAMLFVRGENGGISHNPLESSTTDDIDLSVQALQHLLQELAFGA